MFCPRCKSEIITNSKYCSNCGTQIALDSLEGNEQFLNNTRHKHYKTLLLFILSIFSVLLSAFLLFAFYYGSESTFTNLQLSFGILGSIISIKYYKPISNISFSICCFLGSLAGVYLLTIVVGFLSHINTWTSVQEGLGAGMILGIMVTMFFLSLRFLYCLLTVKKFNK